MFSKPALKSHQNLLKPNSYFINARKSALISLGPRNVVHGSKQKIKITLITFRLTYTERVVKILAWQFGKWYQLTDCHKINALSKCTEKVSHVPLIVKN